MKLLKNLKKKIAKKMHLRKKRKVRKAAADPVSSKKLKKKNLKEKNTISSRKTTDKSIDVVEKPVKETVKEIQPEIVLLDTPEKFAGTKDEIIPKLVDLLRKINKLEKETFEKNKELVKAKAEAGLPEWQEAPGIRELYQEYEDRYNQLVASECTDKLLQRGCGKTFGNPPRYGYVDTGCKFIFTMKSAKKATVESDFFAGVDSKHRFIFRNIEGKWKIDEISYKFENEDSWHIYNI